MHSQVSVLQKASLAMSKEFSETVMLPAMKRTCFADNYVDVKVRELALFAEWNETLELILIDVLAMRS